jgi:hypothetical protein
MPHTREDISISSSDLALRLMPDISETELSNLRWDLQDTIVDTLSNNKNDVSLRKAILIYNQVINRLHDLEMSRRIDPLERLPREIMMEIILNAIILPTYSWYNFVDIRLVLQLTMVSKRWRNFLLSESLLWNTLDLDKQQDTDAKIALQIELSGNLPLNLDVSLPLKSWDRVRPLLIPHRNRIGAIVFHRIIGSDGGELDDFRKFIEDLGPLPNIRCLGESHTNVRKLCDVKGMLDRFPSLKEMPDILFTDSDIHAARNRLNMRTLFTCEDLGTILLTTHTFTNLDTVYCLRNSTLFPRDKLDELQKDLPSISDSPPAWRDLICHGYDNQISSSFLCCLTSLVKLNVSVNLETLHDIIKIIHKLSSLRWVNFIVSPYPNNRILPPSLFTPNFNALSLRVDIRGDSSNEPQKDLREEIDYLSNNINEIPSLLLRAMPNVKSFDLSFAISKSFKLFSFDGTFMGDTLRLYVDRATVILPTEMQIPTSVRELSLLVGADLICSMSSDTVKYLYISPRQGPGESVTNSGTDRLDLNRWPSLESIRVSQRILIQWDKASLAFLRYVSIWVSYPELNVCNSFTSFVKDLACHPESYPFLEEITLGGSPELDILVIMLERRNLLTGPAIKRIKKLEILSPYPPKIRQILSTLIRGKWAERPSNWELSLAGNAEIILDLTL